MRIGKKNRQDLIKRLIETNKISTQAELVRELSKKGIKINQPTISRDLRELGVIRVIKELGKIFYQIPSDTGSVSTDEFRYKFLNLVVDIKHTGNLILIKTYPGEAQGVAKFIDNAKFDTVLGTVAGDDTIIVVANTKPNVKKILRIFDDVKKGRSKKQ